MLSKLFFTFAKERLPVLLSIGCHGLKGPSCPVDPCVCCCPVVVGPSPTLRKPWAPEVRQKGSRPGARHSG